MDHKRQESRKKYGNCFIGNVIRIIDNRTILINVGKVDLAVGDVIQVYELGEILKDTDGSDLSEFYFVKDELEVIQTEARYSVCQKMQTHTYDSGFALSPLLERKIVEYVPLNIDPSDIQELKPKDTLVRIGDPVKLA